MDCPRCQAETKVIKSEPSTEGKARLRLCPTHGRFWSVERLLKWFGATAIQLLGNGSPTAPQRLDNLGGEEGGSGLSSVSSGSEKNGSETPAASQPPSRARRGRGRPSKVPYTAEWNAMWPAMKRKRGNKQPAFEAWENYKSENAGPDLVDANLVVKVWNQWAETDQWQRGFGQYVVTWINQKGWESEPDQVEFKAKNGHQPALPRAVAVEREMDSRRHASKLSSVLERFGGAK